MVLSRAAALLLLFTLVASESGAEMESKPKTWNPIDEENNFLDPNWVNHGSVKKIGNNMLMHTMQHGDGKNFAERGDVAVVQFQGFIHESGQRYENHRNFRKPYSFVVGMGHVIKGWDEGIKMMSVGQRSLIHMPHELAYGPFRSGSGRVPPHSHLNFDIELLGIHKSALHGGKQVGMAFDGRMPTELEAAQSKKAVKKAAAKKQDDFENLIKKQKQEAEEYAGRQKILLDSAQAKMAKMMPHQEEEPQNKKDAKPVDAQKVTPQAKAFFKNAAKNQKRDTKIQNNLEKKATSFRKEQVKKMATVLANQNPQQKTLRKDFAKGYDKLFPKQ